MHGTVNVFLKQLLARMCSSSVFLHFNDGQFLCVLHFYYFLKKLVSIKVTMVTLRVVFLVDMCFIQQWFVKVLPGML